MIVTIIIITFIITKINWTYNTEGHSPGSKQSPRYLDGCTLHIIASVESVFFGCPKSKRSRKMGLALFFSPNDYSLFQAPRESGPLNWESVPFSFASPPLSESLEHAITTTLIKNGGHGITNNNKLFFSHAQNNTCWKFTSSLCAKGPLINAWRQCPF